MASHMLRRLAQSNLTTTLLRRQAIRLISSSAPRILTAAVHCHKKSFYVRNEPVQSLLHNVRLFATAARTIDDLRNQVLNVVKLFDKVDAEQVTLESHFINDLGLDSLDVVEIVMAFEDEFAVEISDEEAEKIMTVNDAVEFLRKALDVA
ncbi:predicted protein [Nematostella vectensis]|uniref:Acyl carrier protein n=1 Tax=Nematostella vectensis TaxID=45351 RepID=A7RJH5_NEMVE|nr:putative acyl carrier protein, mitochondrial [Nematostella vectensis]EDO48263.1 predicted protein [Nematostella vectensis]|eukprot:XP_001640326.1 predicted protein [Nematostella vectensis]